MPEKQRSFHEFMPVDVWKWKIIESKVERLLSLSNYQEIRLSILQDYKVLRKGITALMHGEQAEDITQRVLNLCTPDNNISLLSLRPEGTISVLHHAAGIIQPGEIHRFYYHGPMFRKDKDLNPMEFYQLGVEFLGSDSVLSENEVISLGMKICRELGLSDTTLELNSYGCEDCRRPYYEALRKYLEANKGNSCESCFNTISANPMSDTDCKLAPCRKFIQEAPKVSDFLCEKCLKNFAKVKRIQANLAHTYKVNPGLYKNFSYYNETVFDFIITHKGQKLIIGGGGRYDYLSAKITNKPIPAVGFYLNLDTIFEVMEERRIFSRGGQRFTVYLCAQSPDLEIMMLQIAGELHDNGISTVISPEQLATDAEKQNAGQRGASLMLILRDNNIREGKILMHNLVKNHPAYLPLNQVVDEILIARKALTK